MCFSRNSSPSGCQKMTLDNSNSLEEIEISRKGKYVGKFKILYVLKSSLNRFKRYNIA